MAYRLKQDPESLMKARSILTPHLGDEAWELPDEKITGCAEMLLNSATGVLAPLRPQLRNVSEAIGKTRRGRMLGKLFGIYPYPPVNEYEMLHEIAEQA